MEATRLESKNGVLRAETITDNHADDSTYSPCTCDLIATVPTRSARADTAITGSVKSIIIGLSQYSPSQTSRTLPCVMLLTCVFALLHLRLQVEICIAIVFKVSYSGDSSLKADPLVLG